MDELQYREKYLNQRTTRRWVRKAVLSTKLTKTNAEN
jgi:hypothetical protein